MDVEQLLIGILFVLVGVIVGILTIRNEDFGKDFRLTRGMIGLGFASLLGIVGGIYFIVSSF